MVSSPAAVTAPSKVKLFALIVVAPPKVKVSPKSNELADKVAGLVNVTGPTKLTVPVLVKSPSKVVGPVLSMRNWYSPASTGLATCKLPEPLSMSVICCRLMFVALRPKTIAELFERIKPAIVKPLGAVAVKPPAKYKLSVSIAPNCNAPVLAKVVETVESVTLTWPSKVRPKGLAATNS